MAAQCEDKNETTMKEMEEDEEEEDDVDMEGSAGEEEEESIQKAKQAITCRSVTLTTLMDDGIIKAGEGVLSIDYLGQRFEADLLENGKIKWPQGSQEEFNTPSAWALHCKRLVNPIKRSGCGWASVKYKNRKLDIWKSMWARKHRINNPFKIKSPHQPGQSSSTPQSISPVTSAEIRALENKTTPSTPVTDTNETTQLSPLLDSSGPKVEITPKILTESSPTKKDEAPMQKEKYVKKTAPSESPIKTPSQSQLKRSGISSEDTPLNLSSDLPLVGKKDIHSPVARTKSKMSRHDDYCASRERKSVSYLSLGSRGLDIDPQTLVKCENFDSHSKIQPFTVSLTSNTLLLMDFHCHLTKSEVVGYLGGRWDSHKQHLSVEQVFPIRCRLGDKERAALLEDEIRRSMKQKNQMVVGWYHSHPYCPPDPSIRDVDCQMSYQLMMRGSGSMYLPCLGFIVSPFEKFPPKPDSKIQAFWVMPNLEQPTSYNIPMHVSYTTRRDSSLTEDLLSDMKNLTEFYSGAVDKVNLKEHWGEAITYLDKVKGLHNKNKTVTEVYFISKAVFTFTQASLRSKLPEDQLESGTFLDYVQQLLRDMR